MTEREICERLLRIVGGIDFAHGRISNEEDVHKAIDCATDALNSVRGNVIDLLLDVALPNPEKEFYDMAMRVLQSPTDRQTTNTETEK